MATPFAGRPNMSKRSSSRTSRPNGACVRAMKDKDVGAGADHPEASVKHIVRGKVRRGLKPVPPEASISLRIDAAVLDRFKAQGPGSRRQGTRHSQRAIRDRGYGQGEAVMLADGSSQMQRVELRGLAARSSGRPAGGASTSFGVRGRAAPLYSHFGPHGPEPRGRAAQGKEVHG